MIIEILVIAVLILTNGLLAMSELAVVSSRPARLKVLDDMGASGARAALRLSRERGRFLSTVQIGITLIGVLSGAFSGATLGARLAEWLHERGFANGIADTVGMGAVVVVITYLSLIVGELVPKQVALQDPERVACRVSAFMILLSRVFGPLVWMLNSSGRMLLRMLGQSGRPVETVTAEEVKMVIAEAESAGVLMREEHDMISGVMRFVDRKAKGLMTPRRDVEIVDLREDTAGLLRQLRETRHARLPVRDGDPDTIIGVVAAKSLVPALTAGQSIDLREFVSEIPVIMDGAVALDVLAAVKSSPEHMALVFDEYGHFEGIVTSTDILEAITGLFWDSSEEEMPCVLRDDGSWLVSGWMKVDEFSDKTGVPIDRNANYETVGGLVITALLRLPEVGESFQVGNWRIEVVDMDGRRVDKVLVSRIR